MHNAASLLFLCFNEDMVITATEKMREEEEMGRSSLPSAKGR